MRANRQRALRDGTSTFARVMFLILLCVYVCLWVHVHVGAGSHVCEWMQAEVRGRPWVLFLRQSVHLVF